MVPLRHEYLVQWRSLAGHVFCEQPFTCHVCVTLPLCHASRVQALEAGRHRTCYKYSAVCEYKAGDMINQDGLRAWKLMYKVLTMKALAVRNGKQF